MLHDTWLDFDGGHLVIRETAPKRWAVTWYPSASTDPRYPSWTLGSEEIDVPADGSFEDVVQWAYRTFRDRDNAIAA